MKLTKCDGCGRSIAAGFGVYLGIQGETFQRSPPAPSPEDFCDERLDACSRVCLSKLLADRAARVPPTFKPKREDHDAEP